MKNRDLIPRRRVLGQQPIVAETKAGRFTRLGLCLEHKKGKHREERANEG